MLSADDFQVHLPRTGALINIGGYPIPAYYQDAITEFRAAQKAAMMNRSHVGKLRVFGKDRESLLHRLTTNEMRNLPVGGGVVNMFTNAKGRVVDIVEMFVEAESIFILTSPGRAQILKEWIEKYTFVEDVKSEDVTTQYGVISFLGEESEGFLQEKMGWKMDDLPGQSARTFSAAGSTVVVHRSGTFSPAQFNLIVSALELPNLWTQLMKHATPVGHEVYDMLRIQRGLPRLHKEITEEYNPHEVGLYPLINFEKGCYIGQEVIARLDTYQKVQRQLLGINLEIYAVDDPRLALTPAPIYLGEQMIGQLTSACFSPALGHGIGLAVVRKQFATHTEPVQIRWPERTTAGQLRGLPFV